MTALSRAAIAWFALAALTACASGGGGGSSGGGGDPSPIPIGNDSAGGGPPADETTFTSFSAIAPSQSVVIEGTATTASGDQLTASNGHNTITSSTMNDVGDGTVRLVYDGTRALKELHFSTPQSSVSFDSNTPGHSLSCIDSSCVASKPNASAFAVDAIAEGWNYQTFGIWSFDVSPTLWSAGAISVGNPTAGNAIPLSGRAVFGGRAGGFYFDTNGTPFITFAAMSADVDFSRQSIAFSTSDTMLTNGNTRVRTGNAGLNLRGTLSYSTGVNAFSGAVNTANTLLTGEGSGRFYGPAAEEIGGVYSLQGPGGTMFGGFGGKR